MNVKVLKNITHNGFLHLAGTIADLEGVFDQERLVNSGHISLDVTEKDLKKAEAGQSVDTPPSTQQSQEEQAQAASPTPPQSQEQASDDTQETPKDPQPPADQEKAAEEKASEDGTQPDNTHTVLEGETLTSIAEMFGITVDELAQANNIPATSEPEPGVVLTLPEEKE